MNTRYLSPGRGLYRLLLLVGLLLGLGLLANGWATPAHAATTLTVSTCDEPTLDAAISQANSDNADDTITFACSGDITLTKTLTISGSMTLDGSGQTVTLDGGNSTQALSVKSGVSFTLNALTIAHGSATSGGGLLNSGTVNISNSTFSGNSAGEGAGLDNSGTVNIGGSIVAENTGGNCANIAPITDQGYNLSSDSSCSLTGTGSVQNTDPKLGPLASNGGPTQTMALQPGSPAIDAIPLSANICPSTDQRGDARPNNAETTCDMGAYESSYDDDLELTVPSNITVGATSPQGASVTFTATATDESGDSPSPAVSCTPASGSTFPIGTTKVTCTATDSDDSNSPVSQSFTVTVNDTDLGLTNMPANITTNATSLQGATVTYTLPTVVDEDSPLPSAACTPASGSTFAIGTTTVTCTVSDSDDANSPVSGSFQVVVVGVSDQVSALINLVNSFHLSPPGIQTSFDSQLQAVQADLAANNTAQACSDLASFISHAQAESGKHLTVSQANQMIAAAKQIQAVLGC